MKYDWLDEGTFHMMLPDRLVNTWRGAGSPDYDRACSESDEWLTLLTIGDSQGLVLGGDPGMVLVLPCDSELPVLIRWIYADDEQELIDFALRGEPVMDTSPDVVWENQDTSWSLFDAAAYPPQDRPGIRRVRLPVGRLRVETAFVEAGANSAVIHRFTRVSGSSLSGEHQKAK
ncbi:MAG: Imm21 family immunity protein [Pirellulaceae bacterium]